MAMITVLIFPALFLFLIIKRPETTGQVFHFVLIGAIASVFGIFKMIDDANHAERAESARKAKESFTVSSTPAKERFPKPDAAMNW